MSGNKPEVAPSVGLKAVDAADEAPLREPGSERAITGDEKCATAAGEDKESPRGASAAAVGRADLEPRHAYSSDGANCQAADREDPPPKPALAPPACPTGGSAGAEHPLRLLIPKNLKISPYSSRGSSPSGGTRPPPSGLVGLRTAFESAVESTAIDVGGRQIIPPSASWGTNSRTLGSPDRGVSPPTRARRVSRGRSLPTSLSRGLVYKKSPRTSLSPEMERKSMSYVDFVKASNNEMSSLGTLRLTGARGKKPRDGEALRVAVRVRPLIARERGSGIVTCKGGEGQMVVVNPKKFKASADAVLAIASAVSRANMVTTDWLRPFDFDRVFWSYSSVPIPRHQGRGEMRGVALEAGTQQEVYEGLGAKIIDDVMNGFNCSCFAYGHTGSGKTYSMFGSSDDTSLPEDLEALAAPPDGEEFGLVPRVCYHLLRRLHEGREGLPPHVASGGGVSVQFIEIYNGKIRDLLHPTADSSAFRVREHPQAGPYVDNLIPVEVESWSQLRQVLALGCAARTKADTLENNNSSRGHAILTLEIKAPGGLTRVQMVDLAGSEREPPSSGEGPVDVRAQQQGRGSKGKLVLAQRLRETAQIKKALSNLGVIIKGLSRGNTPVGMPFRDSTLTWLLKEALSGRAHTTMLATVSPSSCNYVETMHTLKYAERLRRANAHFDLHGQTTGPRLTKPSDGMKKEMRGLVEMLGADGVEARRQLLCETVSDPQQRIAKLTNDDPRRLRRFRGDPAPGAGGRRLASDSGGTDSRRSSSPIPLSATRYGLSHPDSSLSHESEPGECYDGSLENWGSPIHAQEDFSTESVQDDGSCRADGSKGSGRNGGSGKERRQGGASTVDNIAARVLFSEEAPVGDRNADGGEAIGGAQDGSPRQHPAGQEERDLADISGAGVHAGGSDKLYSKTEGEEGEGEGVRDAGDGDWGASDSEAGGTSEVGGDASRGEYCDYGNHTVLRGGGRLTPPAAAPASGYAANRRNNQGRGQPDGGFDSPGQRSEGDLTGITAQEGVPRHYHRWDMSPQERSSSPVWGGTNSSEAPRSDRADVTEGQDDATARSFGGGVNDPDPRISSPPVSVRSGVHVSGSPGPPVNVRYDSRVTFNPGASPGVSVHYDNHAPGDPDSVPPMSSRNEARVMRDPPIARPATVQNDTLTTENSVRAGMCAVDEPSDQVPPVSIRSNAAGAGGAVSTASSRAPGEVGLAGQRRGLRQAGVGNSGDRTVSPMRPIGSGDTYRKGEQAECFNFRESEGRNDDGNSECDSYDDRDEYEGEDYAGDGGGGWQNAAGQVSGRGVQAQGRGLYRGEGISRHDGYREAGAGERRREEGEHRRRGPLKQQHGFEDEAGTGDGGILMNRNAEPSSSAKRGAAGGIGLLDSPGVSAALNGDGDGTGVGRGMDIDSGVCDADSLVGFTEQEAAWTPQRAAGDEGVRQAVRRGARGAVQADDSQRLINMRQQVEELKARNAALEQGLRWLKKELRRSKELEEEAWTLGDEAASELESRLASAQRDLEGQVRLAGEAERGALEAQSLADDALADARDVRMELEETLRRANENEQRAAEAEAKEQDARDRADDARARIRALVAAMDKQRAAVEEANSRAEHSRAVLEAVEDDLDAAESAAQKADGSGRRADRAVAKAEELEAVVDDQNRRLTRAIDAIKEQGARADETERRADEAEARVDELAALVSEKDVLLAEAKDAVAGQEARAQEATERARAAEVRAVELEARTEREQAGVGEPRKEKIVKWEARVQEALERSGVAEDRAAELERTLERIQSELGEVKSRAVAEEARSDEVLKRARASEDRAMELEARAGRQQADIEEARRGEIAKQEATIIEALERARAAEDRAAELEKEAEWMQSEIEEARKKTATEEARVQETSERAQVAEDRLAELETRPEREQGEAGAATDGVGEQEARIQKALERARVAEDRVVELEKKAELMELEDETKKEAIVKEMARAQDAAECARVAEDRATELEAWAKRMLSEVEEARREAVAEQEARVQEANGRARAAEYRATALEKRAELIQSEAEEARREAVAEQEARVEEANARARAAEDRAVELDKRAEMMQLEVEEARREVTDDHARFQEAFERAQAAEDRVAELEKRAEREQAKAEESIREAVRNQMKAQEPPECAGAADDRAAELDARAEQKVVAMEEARREVIVEQEARLQEAFERARSAEDWAEELEKRAKKKLGEVEETKREAIAKQEARVREALDRARAAEGRVVELEAIVEQKQVGADKARREVIAEQEARVQEAFERARAAEDRAVEMEARAQQNLVEAEEGRKEMEASLTERLAAAEAERKRADALREAIGEEQDRKHEQAEVQELLAFISSVQQADSQDSRAGGDANAPALTVAIAGARSAVEVQRAKHEAALRRLEAIESENRSMKRGMDDQGRHMGDTLQLFKEEKKFLLHENEDLVDRLGSLEERQTMSQAREGQADYRELEEELERTKKHLGLEAELRAKEGEEFAAHLKQKDEQMTKDLDEAMKNVMEGVKTQAGRIRETIERLEWERDAAFAARDAAKTEIEQSSRERAALWLAVNKLDVLEAAKDAAIKELQAEGENKSRALRVLHAHNAGLAKELEQVDLSLMQAVEDIGPPPDSANLQDTSISRRSAGYGQKGDMQSSTQHPKPNTVPVDMEGSFSTNGHFVRAGTVGGRVKEGAETSWHRPPRDRVAAPAETESVGRRDPPSHPSWRHDPSRATEDSEEALGCRVQYQGRGAIRNFGARGDGNPLEKGAERGRVSSGFSNQADRWDPAMATIEREIEELSERLEDQPRRRRAATCVRNARGQDAVERDAFGRSSNQGTRGVDAGHSPNQGTRGVSLGPPTNQGTRGTGPAPSGGVAKRPRVKASEVSPTITHDAQRPRRERGRHIP